MRPFEYIRAAPTPPRPSRLVSARPGRGLPGRRHDAARPDAQGRRRRAATAWSTSPGCRCAGIIARRVVAPRRRADDDGGARRGRRRSPSGSRSCARRCCSERVRAAAQHGDDRRQPAAAHALPLLPRPDGRGLQQARPRVGLRRGRRRGQRCTRSSARASTASRCTPPTCASRSSRSTRRAHPGPGRRRVGPADGVLRAPGRAAGRRERARPRRADHRGRDPAAAGGHARPAT